MSECEHEWIGDTCTECGVAWNIYAQDEINQAKYLRTQLATEYKRGCDDTWKKSEEVKSDIERDNENIYRFWERHTAPGNPHHSIYEWLGWLVDSLATAQAEVERLKKECVDNQDWINSLCKDICKMEDALGFANDQHDKSGAFVPTIGPWLERVRDLIAAEGELGDVKADLTKRDEVLMVARGLLVESKAYLGTITGWSDNRDRCIAAIHSCLGTTEGGEK